MDIRATEERTITCEDCGATEVTQMPKIFGNVPFTRCTPCLEAANERDRKAKHQKFIQEMVERSGIPAKYQTWDADKAKEIGSNTLLRWVIQRQGASMWIGGPNGIGKTHATHHIAYQRIVEHGEPVRALRCSGYLRNISTLRMTDQAREAERLVQDAVRVSLLVLDDLGKEKLTDAKAEVLWELIDLRSRSEKRVWITTNSSGPKLRERLGDNYGPAVLSRLKQMIPTSNILKGQE